MSDGRAVRLAPAMETSGHNAWNEIPSNAK
jgi:hypothetical protein